MASLADFTPSGSASPNLAVVENIIAAINGEPGSLQAFPLVRQREGCAPTPIVYVGIGDKEWLISTHTAQDVGETLAPTAFTGRDLAVGLAIQLDLFNLGLAATKAKICAGDFGSATVQ